MLQSYYYILFSMQHMDGVESCIYLVNGVDTNNSPGDDQLNFHVAQLEGRGRPGGGAWQAELLLGTIG